MKLHWNKLVIVTLLVGGIARGEESTRGTNRPVPLDVPLTDQQFVTDAAMASMVEVYISQIALDRSTNYSVRSFANRMVKDHSAANNTLQKLAQKKGLSFPPTNTFSPDDPNWKNPLVAKPEEVKGAQMLMTTNLAELAGYRAINSYKTLNGAEFDRVFWTGMSADHRLVVNEFELATNSLPDPDLKKFAKKTLPTLQNHLKMAQHFEHDPTYGATNQPTRETLFFNPP